MPVPKTPKPPITRQAGAAADPDRGARADDRLRPLRGEAHGRRARAGRRRHLQRRPRRRCARSCASASRARKRWHERPMRRVDAARRRRSLGGRVRGHAARTATRGRSRPGSTRSPAGATSCGASSTPARPTSPASCRRASLLLERAARAREGRRRDAHRRRARGAARPATPDEAQRGRARPRAARGRRSATPTAAARRRMDRTLHVDVDRERARFGAWYELFPRSWGGLQGRREAAARARRARLRRPLPAADPPDRRDEPQGREQRADRRARATPARRGRSATRAGGHTALHPDLGTMDDFDALVATAQEHGIDIALDFAIQCSADHPWLTEHPEWFNRRPDGTLKYAENPPKKYQDIYNVNFDCEDWRGAVGRAARRRALLGRPRREGLPRRQPAHEAVRLLGVAHRRGARRAPRRRSSSPRRSRARR